MNQRLIASLIVLSALAVLLPLPLSAMWTENGSPVITGEDYQYDQRMVTDGAGGAIVCWYDWRSALYLDIYAQRIDAAGNLVWISTGIPVCTASDNQVDPYIISDGEGGAIITWQDYRSTDADVYAQRINAAGNIQWSTGGVAICTDAAYQTDPRIASDGAGGAIITWHDTRGSDLDIYAQQINADGIVQWTANGVAVISLSFVQRDPTIVSDGSGGAVIVWNDTRNSSEYDIYAQRIDATGNFQWTSMGVPICTAANYQMYSQMIPDGSGGAIIVWQDGRNFGIHDIYAQHLAGSGTVQWATDGVPVIAAANNQLGPQIVSDGAGGIFVAWKDYRTGISDIFAQRLDSGGNLLWNSAGVPICTFVNYQYDPVLAEDGEGGIYVAWYDNRNATNYNLYCQRVNGSGIAQWAAGGTGICVYDGYHIQPQMIPDGNGGAIISWIDTRDSENDIYASQVDGSGRTGYMPPVIHSIGDVPNDQGGIVNLAWYSSVYDNISCEITHYSIWRALSTPAAYSMMAGGALLLAEPGDLPAPAGAAPPMTGDPVLRQSVVDGQAYFWELISTADAYYLEGYSITAPTAFDSMAADPGYQHFQVIAHTESPPVFFVSEPDSGYSVDNLAPAAPLGLAGEQVYMPEGLQLTWDPNSEGDLAGYNIYRGTSSGFIPGPGNFVTSTPDTMTLDGDWSWEVGYWYKISAVDIHGNESSFAVTGPDAITGDEPIPTPEATFLAQNYPNPFNPLTNIGFGIKERAYVSLRIYDAAGRLVATLIDESRPAGNYTAAWNGRGPDGSPAASGVYFYRIKAGNFLETRKMILLR